MWKYWKMRAMHFVKKWAIKSILKAVHEDELLVVTSKGWYVGTHRIPQQEVTILKEEAREFRGSYLWKLMSQDVRYIAFLRATNKATSGEDLLYSSAMYYNLQLLEEFMKKCESL